MRSLTSDEVKKTGLSLLLVFDKFCKKHNLEYFLSYGTLLGAIRHSGFIPWDDDIDVVMGREEYERFITLWMEEEKRGDRVGLLSPSDSSLSLCFAKLVDYNTSTFQNMFYTKKNAGVANVWIDIFPMDGTSSDVKKAKRHSARIAPYTYFQILTNVYFKNIFLRILTFPILVGFRIFRKHIMKTTEKIAKKFKYADSEYVGNFAYTFSQKSERFEKKLFEETTTVSFEGHDFPSVKDYDFYLKHLYGDYMTPPKEGKREQHHLGIKFYLIDEAKGLLEC